MARFWLTPRWLVGHILVVVIVALFISLGLWQLRRLDERRAYNAVVVERMSAAEQPLEELLGAPGDPEQLAYRRVEVRGTYATGEELLLGPRSRAGEPGYHVLTPLLIDDGAAVLIDRGWVPYLHDQPPVAAAAPPAGEVAVSGLVRLSQEQAGFGPRIPDDGPLTAVPLADIERVQRQISAALAPVYVQLATQDPPQAAGGLPLPAEPPELGEANHLSYAIQWFAFALIGVVGYAALLRRTGRDTGAPLARHQPKRATPV